MSSRSTFGRRGRRLACRPSARRAGGADAPYVSLRRRLVGLALRGYAVPAVFLGIALAMLAVVLVDVSLILAVAVGTAASTADMMRLLLTPLVLAALLVGLSGLVAIPAAVLAASAAWITRTALHRRFEPPAAPSPA